MVLSAGNSEEEMFFTRDITSYFNVLPPNSTYSSFIDFFSPSPSISMYPSLFQSYARHLEHRVFGERRGEFVCVVVVGWFLPSPTQFGFLSATFIVLCSDREASESLSFGCDDYLYVAQTAFDEITHISGHAM